MQNIYNLKWVGSFYFKWNYNTKCVHINGDMFMKLLWNNRYWVNILDADGPVIIYLIMPFFRSSQGPFY